MPTLELVDTTGEHPMYSGMLVAAMPVISDTLLTPFDGRTDGNKIHRSREL